MKKSTGKNTVQSKKKDMAIRLMQGESTPRRAHTSPRAITHHVFRSSMAHIYIHLFNRRRLATHISTYYLDAKMVDGYASRSPKSAPLAKG